MPKLYSYCLLLILLCTSFSLDAQVYGNEWIEYDQKYYAFKVYPESIPYNFGDYSHLETGIYILDYDKLVASNIPLESISSSNIQIFGKEKEIPLFINDGGDNSIDSGDYILFYTERNDSWLDSMLYEDPNTIGNSYRSLYSDTLEYFFTSNNSGDNLRFVSETDINFSSYTPSNYLLYTWWYNNNNQYRSGENTNGSLSSFFKSGEGWSGNWHECSTGYNWGVNGVEITRPYISPGAPNVKFTVSIVGNSDADYTGIGNHHIYSTIGVSNHPLIDSIWVGYKGVNHTITFPANKLPASGSSNWTLLSLGNLGVTTDKQSVSFTSFKYPRTPTFDGENKLEFQVVNNPTESKIRLDLTNIGYSNPVMFVLGDTPRKVELMSNGGVYSTLIPNSASGEEQHVVYQDSSTIRSVDTLIPVNGNGFFTDFGSLSDKENALIIISHPLLDSATTNYDIYRSSNEGGNNNVVKADINELYQQFGGGIPKHINGVRRFAHLMHNQAIDKPVGLFLAGKGLTEATINSLPGYRFNPVLSEQCLIPSFGNPPSDNCITAGLESPYETAPLIPTGRISARSNNELQEYLEKVNEYESQQDSTHLYDFENKDWQKQVMHLTGGLNGQQQQNFQNYMSNLADIISDSLYGANMTVLNKESADPFEPTELNSITQRIEDGLSLMTYFGHAAATTSGFEINLDEPQNWNNQGKYPLMLVNSCYNGNIFQPNNSKSEEFVQLRDAGAIGYISTVNQGFDTYLHWYCQELYKQFSYKNYNATLGKQMQETIRKFDGQYSMVNTATQMTLNGDPMLKLNSHVAPEIELLEEYVWFTPENPDLTVDSITIHIKLKNLGRSVVDTFNLEIIRDFPASSVDSIYRFQLTELHYETVFKFNIPLQPNISLGSNIFSISVDLPNGINEVYDEINNNKITKSLFLEIDGITPVIPYQFAVIPKDSVTLHASTNNPIADFNTYRFEIDTIDFEGAPSPAHRFALVSEPGGVKTVTPSEWTLSSNPTVNDTLICTDSTVYFWRTSIEGDTNWRESSFQYIEGKSGWGQDHFFQFKKNDFSAIKYERTTRMKTFEPISSILNCYMRNSPGPLNYEISNIMQEYYSCPNELGQYKSIHVAVIDPLTHVPWGTKFTEADGSINNPNHNFGNFNNESSCHSRVERYFQFSEQDPQSLLDLQDMVNNQVPSGHYILIFSPFSTSHNLWDPGMFATLSALGSDSIYPGRPNLPFAFFVKKGDTNTVVERMSQYNGEEFDLTVLLNNPLSSGKEVSPLIGPSTSWESVYWKQDPSEIVSSDSTVLKISGYDIYGNWQNDIITTFTRNDSILNLNGVIDATLYPYISLEAYYTDTLNLTPTQIDRWHVLFSPVAEAAIDGTTQYTLITDGDSLTVGSMVDFAVDVKNIFTVDMDSLLINYWIEDEQHIKHPITYLRQDSLLVGETLRDTISFSTVNLEGSNILWMEVNPYINGSFFVTDQPEQEHFNNILQLPFYVRPDNRNPLLDVTFNGNHILNGDIVDPNSEIYITLKDDNEYLLMDNIEDTASFGIYLTNPAGVQTRIPFNDASGNSVMQWIPANSQNRRFKIIWPAAFEQDGVYSLFVQGSDKSGNISGDIDYRVDFEIIHESTITKMMNYPNPFSTSTRFVFTLTGSVVPDDVLIQIMTVTGRIIKEINEDELGPVQIGRNITEYAWDGTDQFGDPLANGVYLYRVIAKINGEDIKARESGADKHFKKSFGKMYILR